MISAAALPIDTPSSSLHRPLTIVHGVLSLDVGGLERMVLNLACRAAHEGNDVSIVCVEREGELAPLAKAAGVKLYCLHKPPGRSQRAINGAATLLATLRPDVIHSHHIGVLWYLASAAKRLGITNVVHTEHCDQVAQERHWLRKLHARGWWWYAGNMAREFCCVSDDIAVSAQRWRTLAPKRVHVVRNGIAMDAYGTGKYRCGIRQQLGIADEMQVIGTVGRLAEVKRQDRLLRAVAELRRRALDVCLLIVGDGPQRQELAALAGELGIAHRVHFVGYQPHPEHYFEAMDVFALSSRHEGLPLALLEAWASALPVVASAVGGIVKVVQHDHTGLLFERDNLPQFVESLQSLVVDAGFRRRLAAAGYAEARRHYSAERMSDNYHQRYVAGLPHQEANPCSYQCSAGSASP